MLTERHNSRIGPQITSCEQRMMLRGKQFTYPSGEKQSNKKNDLLKYNYKEIPDTYILILEKSFAVQRPYIQDLSDRWK